MIKYILSPVLMTLIVGVFLFFNLNRSVPQEIVAAEKQENTVQKEKEVRG